MTKNRFYKSHWLQVQRGQIAIKKIGANRRITKVWEFGTTLADSEALLFAAWLIDINEVIKQCQLRQAS